MRYKGLDLNLLVALDAVFATASITRAAEILNMSQPAVSNAMARSREYFDDPLVSLVGRRMILTPKGEKLKIEIRQLLDQVDRGLCEMNGFDPAGIARTVGVMLPQAVAIRLMPLVCRHLRDRAPRLAVDCIPLDGDPILLLDQGKIDLVILPDQYASEAHPKVTLYDDPFCCIVDSGSAFEGEIPVEAYLAARHVLVKIGSARKTPLDRVIIESTLRSLTEGVAVFDHTHVPWHVAGSDLVGTIPRSVADQFASVLPIRVLPLPVAVPPLRLVAQWHASSGGGSLVEWLAAEMRDVAQEFGHSSG